MGSPNNSRPSVWRFVWAAVATSVLVAAGIFLFVRDNSSTDSSPAATTTTITIQGPSCEELLQVDECPPGTAERIGYDKWRQNLPAYIETGVLARYGLPGQPFEYARFGFNTCFLADLGFGYERWLEFAVQMGAVSLDADHFAESFSATVDIWNTTLRSLCPEHQDMQRSD